MRLPLLILFLITLLPVARAQEYPMNNTPVSACSGTFTDFGGSSGNYPNSQNLTKIIRSSNGERLRVSFTSFSTENGFDFLYIYDGDGPNAPMIARLTGNLGASAGVFTSMGSALTFAFISDQATVSSGWTATISCQGAVPTSYTLSTGPAVTTCNALVTDDGGYDGPYSNDQEVTRTFCSANGQHLMATAQDYTLFMLAGDTLFVYDGNSAAPASLMAAYTNGSGFETLYSTGTCLTLRFKTNSAGNTAGFGLLLTCTANTPPIPTFNLTGGMRRVCQGSLFDPGGPSGSYFANYNVQESFFAPSNQRLTITFNSFSTEAGFDFLQVYDGPSSNAPLIGTYSGSVLPPAITSSGSSLTFRFTSDQATNFSGWNASFSCGGTALTAYPMTSGTTTACSGAFYDAGGSQTNYPDNENRTQTFCSGTADKLKFTFNPLAFHLVSGDTLKIYDGNSTAATPIGFYTTGSTVEEFTSSGTCATMKFTSNGISNNDGWQALFACTTASITNQVFSLSAGTRYVGCSATVYDPGGPSFAYGANQNVTETFTSANGERLKLEFGSFSTEAGFDFLQVYDGPGTGYPLIGTYTGSSVPAIITSSSRSLTLRFTSDQATNFSGFVAALSCAGPVLSVHNMSSGTVTTCSGVFYDAGGSNANYPDGENRVQTFCSQNGQNLRFNFNNEAFALADQDSLFVYDGNSTASDPLAVYVTNSHLEDIQSTGSCLTFRFKASTFTSDDGWQALFACTSQALPSQPIAMSTGRRWVCNTGLQDNGGGAAYSAGQNRTQTYSSRNGLRLRLAFSTFSTESGSDFLRIYDGPSTAYPLIGTYTGSTLPPVIESTGTSLTFWFTSDGSQQASGWNADLQCFGTPLAVHTFETPTVTACSGVVYDPGGPGASYLPNQDKVQTFCSDNGQYMSLTFNNQAFTIGNADTLYVYDGNSASAPLRAKYYEGSHMVDPLYSTGTCLTLRLYTSAFVERQGFQAFISCIAAEPLPRPYTMTTSTQVTCSGSFTDPGGAGAYPASQTVIQTFVAEGGHKLTFKFNGFSTESGSDFLTIYDGPGTSSPSLGAFSGTAGPGTFTSSGPKVTFRWTSDGSDVRQGWQADVACIADVPLAQPIAGGPFCAGSVISVPYTSPTVQAGNVFTAQLSDANGLFTNPTVIGAGTSTSGFGSISATLPTSLAAGTGYRVRILASSPAMTGSASSFTLTVLAAAAQPGTVSGPAGVCAGATGQVYSIPSAANAASYVWSVPQGATITAGQGTTSVTVDFGTTGGNVTVFSSNNCGNSVERAFGVSITAPTTPTPFIRSDAPGNQICPGATVTFSATINAASATYQWRHNGVDIPNATGSAYTTIPIIGDAYTVFVRPAGCFSPATAVSNSITLSAASTAQPRITIDGPAAPSLCQLDTLELTATAQNPGTTPTYFWYKNNALFSQQASPILRTTNVANGDRFFLILQSSMACANPNKDTSQTVTVTVRPSVQTSIRINVMTPQPICEGAAVLVRANLHGAGTNPNIDWYVDNALVFSGRDSSFFVTATPTMKIVRAVLTSSIACAVPASAPSNPDTVQGAARLTPPAITLTSDAPNGDFCTGTQVQFATQTTGSGTYQWFRNNILVPGAGLPTLRITNPANNDEFRVEFTPSGCYTPLFSTSNAITLHHNAVVPTQVSISGTGSTRTMCQGDSLRLDLTVSGQGAAPVYRWFKNDAFFSQQSTPSLRTLNAAQGDRFFVIVQSSSPCANPARDTSQTIAVTVTPSVLSTISLSTTAANPACARTNLLVHANLHGAGPNPTLAWTLNGVPVAGTRDSTKNVASNDPGTLVVRVTLTSSLACAVPRTTSDELVFTILPLVRPTVAVTGPGPLCQGAEFSFLAVPSPVLPLQSFQWMLDGVDVPGADALIYRTTTVQRNQMVTVRMTTPGQCISSPVVVSTPVFATIFPNETPDVQIRARSGSDTLCTGGFVSLEALNIDGGGGNPRYTWLRNGVPIAGVTISTLFSPLVIHGDVFSVVMKSSLNCLTKPADTSGNIVITMYHPAATFTQVGDTLIATATDAFRYQWYRNGAAIAGATGQKHVPTITGDYHVRAISRLASCFDDADPQFIVVTRAQPALARRLSLYPNPARDALWLEGLPGNRAQFACTTASGTRLPVSAIQVDGRWKLDVTHLARGLYTLEVRLGSGVERMKWVKE